MIQRGFTAEIAAGAAFRFRRMVDYDGIICLRLGSQCWDWTGSVKNMNPNGPGRCHGSFRYATGGGSRYAHVASFRMHYFDGGPIMLSGAVVAHKCDRSICVRPEHLYLTTAVGNRRDKFCSEAERRGREDRGMLLVAALLKRGEAEDEIAALADFHDEISGNYAYRRAREAAWADCSGRVER